MPYRINMAPLLQDTATHYFQKTSEKEQNKTKPQLCKLKKEWLLFI